MMNALLSTILLSAAAVSAGPGLDVKVSAPADPVSINQLAVKTTVTNTGDEPLKLFNNPNTILSTTNTDSFMISSPAGAPTFSGIRLKWSPKLAAESGRDDEFTFLAPGQSVETVHSLAGVYNFTQTGEGQYTFVARSLFDYVDPSGAVKSIQATSSSQQFQLSGLLAVPSAALSNHLARRRDFNGCSESQRSDINNAALLSDAYVAQANLYLQGNPPDQRPYVEWFGIYDNMRKSMVASHFQRIGNQATSNRYDCTCTKKNVFAYVYPDIPGMVYLCPAFWNAPSVGFDSKAGTIVHENSHFLKNGGTQDYTYGQDNCHNLANNDPDGAIMNADSHEYFVEAMTAPAA